MAAPLLRSSPWPSCTTPLLPVVWLLMSPAAVRRQLFWRLPPPLTVTTPTTVVSAVLVKAPTMFKGPAIVSVPLLVTVDPFRFTPP